jgi:hypothetical protein
VNLGRSRCLRSLADAQFVVARELRFASCAKLQAHIESLDQRTLELAKRLDSRRQVLQGDGPNLFGQWKGDIARMYHAQLGELEVCECNPH